MPILTNRAKANTATTGTGTVTLGSGVVPYQSWSASGAVNGRSYDYLIEDGTNWEIGTGVYNSGAGTVTRPGPGVDPNFESNTGSLLNLSGSATIACVANKNSNNWVLIEDFTISTGIANRDVNVSAYDEIMCVAQNVTAAGSGVRGVLVSTDGGATFWNTSGNYTTTTPAGVTSNGIQVDLHATASTAARGGIVTGHGIRGSSGPKVFRTPNTTQGLLTLFLQSNSPITHIRYYNSGSTNMTAGRLITYGR